jgi:hypothetical protein
VRLRDLQKSAIDITFGAVFTAAVFSVRFPIVFDF